MGMKIRLSVAAIGLAFAALTQPANADVKYSGPGYYIEKYDQDWDMNLLMQGPYSNEADCKAAIAVILQQDALPSIDSDDRCEHEASDPYAPQH